MVKNERISDERLAEMLESMAQYGHMEHASLGFPIFEMKLMVAELSAIRAANSDGGVEPGKAVQKAMEVLNFVILAGTSISEAHDGTPVSSYSKLAEMAREAWNGLASVAHPPAKALDGIAVTQGIISETIWNEHLFHVDALLYDDKMITPDMAMAERLSALIVAALAVR